MICKLYLNYAYTMHILESTYVGDFNFKAA